MRVSNKKHLTGARRQSRIIALQVLYEIDGVNHNETTAIAQRLEEKPLAASGEKFMRYLVTGVLDNRPSIDQMILEYATERPIDQISMVDRNILRMAIFEIAVGGKTPIKVAINEAVELGKTFGSDNSYKFVNAVLGSLVTDRKSTAYGTKQ